MANATAPATFSVPERRPRSWPPPCSTGSSGSRPRTMSAPVPFGAPTLWPASERASTPSPSSESGSQPGRLHGIRVHQRARRVGDRGELGHRLHRADLVVRELHRDERRVGPDDARERLGMRRAPPASTSTTSTSKPCTRAEVRRRLEHRLVLDRRDDDVPAARVRERDALDGEVVGLGAAAREDDVARAAADDRGHLAPGPPRGRGRPRRRGRAGSTGCRTRP